MISTTPIPLQKNEELFEFMSFYPNVAKDLTDACSGEISPLVANHFSNVLNYNLPNGKKLRGLAIVRTYKRIELPENISSEKLRLVCILGWCVEMAQAAMVIIDDVLDRSETRRGLPCWYKLQKKELSAVNDGVLVENAIYILLKEHFSDHKYYVHILELFHRAFMKAVSGEFLDLACAVDENNRTFEHFTMSTYNSLTLNKCSFYTFILPVALAMYFADRYDTKLDQQITSVLNGMGLLYQMQDDFLDGFGNTQIVGKDSSDIRSGKCSWLAVTALQLSTPDQRKLFQQCYGRSDDESQTKILDLYQQLDLSRIYPIHETKLLDKIHSGINKLDNHGFPRDILLDILGKQIFKF